MVLSFPAVAIGLVAIILSITISAYQSSPAILQQIITWDFGNAIAALVAVAGYMIDHYFSRKQVRECSLSLLKYY